MFCDKCGEKIEDESAKFCRNCGASLSNYVKEEKPKPARTKKAPSTVRSIEINPDEIDRIYVKKIS